MKLSTATGDFSRYIDNIADKVKQYKDLPFKYITLDLTADFPIFTTDDNYALKRYADELDNARSYANVEYVFAHAPVVNPFAELNEIHYTSILNHIKNSIEVCHILGVNRIVVHAGSNTEFDYQKFYDANKKFYHNLLPIAEKYNIMILTENMHPRPTIEFSTGLEMREFLDDMSHPLLAACWDTAHANLNPNAKEIGEYNNIIALGNKLKGLHISDNYGRGHQHSWPFSGNINFDEVMQGLIDIKYDGYFNFEASYTLLHQKNPSGARSNFKHNGQPVTKLSNPTLELKKKAIELLYEIGKHILTTYDSFEE